MELSHLAARPGAAHEEAGVSSRGETAAEVGSVYPLVAYGGIDDASAQEDAEQALAEHVEELDEVIFSGIVALR